MTQISTTAGTVSLSGLPNKCPFCHNHITPLIIANNRIEKKVEAIMVCPSSGCKKSFVAYYDHSHLSNYGYTGKTSIGTPVTKEFDECIHNTSKAFINIYNQAFFAEQHGLEEICGVGYRKALEFLIKDYCIQKYPDYKDKILTSQLATCITDYVEDTKIKTVSQRAVWLGNDETHYIRKWENKDINDLKRLIDLTLHWIEAEHLTSVFEQEMPYKGRT